MRRLLASALTSLAARLHPKAAPPDRRRPGFTGGAVLDPYRRHREPGAAELLAELKNTAWTCAAINAAVCASYPPRLYVATRPGEAPPRCLTRALSPECKRRLYGRDDLALRLKGVERVEEVVDHPLLTLLQQVNPVHNAFNL